MKNHIIILFFGILFLSNQAWSQNDNKTEKRQEYPWSYHKEIGMNFTPLVSSLIPFNLGENDAGFRSFTFKRYKRKIAYRFNAGIDIDGENGDDFVLLTLGFERRKPIAKKVTFTSGMDFGLFGFIEENGLFNTSILYGFEYNINDKFFIATEGNFQLLFGNGGQLKVNPPIAIFFYVRY